jgi:DNA processing protein
MRMKEFKAVISALNDNQDLKSRALIHLLFEFLDKNERDNRSLDELVKFFNERMNSGSPRETKVIKEAINCLNNVELGSYLDYLEEMRNEGVWFRPFYSIFYPQKLWKIEDPPLGLYIKGNTSALFGGIAIVGTRDANEQRKDYIRDLAADLATEGYPIVSGLANGIDTVAHNGAIEAGGQTTAILPGGIQTIRPSSNKELGRSIPDHGALVAEISDMENIHRGRFVERNRITSGISISVIIGASGETGGTIRQAEFAEAQSRPRYLYSPERNDGQAPEKLDNFGVSRFSSTTELLELLDEEWREPSHDPDLQQNLKNLGQN